MKIDKFKVEEWFNKYEKDAVYDLADTCVESLSINELLDFVYDREKELQSSVRRDCHDYSMEQERAVLHI